MKYMSKKLLKLRAKGKIKELAKRRNKKRNSSPTTSRIHYLATKD
jgi:hypothetical protein